MNLKESISILFLGLCCCVQAQDIKSHIKVSCDSTYEFNEELYHRLSISFAAVSNSGYYFDNNVLCTSCVGSIYDSKYFDSNWKLRDYFEQSQFSCAVLEDTTRTTRLFSEMNLPYDTYRVDYSTHRPDGGILVKENDSLSVWEDVCVFDLMVGNYIGPVRIHFFYIPSKEGLKIGHKKIWFTSNWFDPTNGRDK